MATVEERLDLIEGQIKFLHAVSSPAAVTNCCQTIDGQPCPGTSNWQWAAPDFVCEICAYVCPPAVHLHHHD